MRLVFPSLVLAVALALGGSPVLAAGTWNAFALDYRGSYGIGLGLDSEDEARAAALAECKMRDCEVVFTSESKCLAVADSRTDGYWYGYAWGDTKLGTETIALGYCLEHDKGNCEPLGSACIGTPDRSVPPADSSTKNKL